MILLCFDIISTYDTLFICFDIIRYSLKLLLCFDIISTYDTSVLNCCEIRRQAQPRGVNILHRQNVYINSNHNNNMTELFKLVAEVSLL